MRTALHVGPCFNSSLPVLSRERYGDGDNIDIGSMCSVILSNEYFKTLHPVFLNIHRSEWAFIYQTSRGQRARDFAQNHIENQAN